MNLLTKQTFLALSVFLIAITQSAQIRCPAQSVFKDGNCIQCSQLPNTVSTVLSRAFTEDVPNFCICQSGYQWLQVGVGCMWTGKNTIDEQGQTNILQMKGSQQMKQRSLQVWCDVSKGFITLNGQCVNCRNYNYSTGFALAYYGCLCLPTFLWQGSNCACQFPTTIYIHQNTCLSCSSITDTILKSRCQKCQNPFASSNFGCIDCSSIPHGLYGQADVSGGFCVCETGYVYSSVLGACFCDQYHFQTAAGCQSCASLTDSKSIADCNECQDSFFDNGYYCQQSSNIRNFDASANACQSGYSLKDDPIRNLTLGCVCSATAGHFLNGSFCLPCSSLKSNSPQSYQKCISCSQTNGYFSGAVECVYCPSVQFGTGIATKYGCECISTRSWNTLTDQCECDWAKGLFTNGTLCVSCMNISHTVSSTSSIGCNCVLGYSWNPNTYLCECNQNAGNFYLSTVEGCVDCNQIIGSTGLSINGSSCQCQAGRVWSTSYVGCLCDMNQNYVLVGVVCSSCGKIKNSNGLANTQGCGCLPGYIWVYSGGICDCPQGYVNMGNKCVSCSVANVNLMNVTVDGCNKCSSNQGFTSSNGICYACSTQTSTLGTVSVTGCDCVNNNQQLWSPALGGCTCTSLYYASISNGTLSCLICGTGCVCVVSSGQKICTNCYTVMYSTGTTSGSNCVCYSGYAWSSKIGLNVYPFQCICNSKAGGYLNGSVCYNCSQLPTNGSITAVGCKNCDPTQGFLYVPKTQSCLVCALQQGSNGKATVEGCGCIWGVWNSNSLVCESLNCSVANCQTCSSNAICYACTNGYLLSVDKQHCSPNCFIAYCDQCSSSSRCQTCILGHQLSSDASRCLVIECFDTCAVCLTNTNCSSCLSGYLLSKDLTQCLFNCPNSNCALCASRSTCSQCAVGYYLQNGDAQNCQIICKVLNCAYCYSNSTFCNYCNPGFTYLAGKCFYSVCIPNCNQCSSATLCNTCIPGYTITNNGSFCSPSCAINNCLQCPNTSHCSSCFAGYYSTNNSTQCLLSCSSSNCLYCQGHSNNCTLCQQGFKLFKGQCYPNICIANCTLCLSNSTCRSCAIGYSPSYKRDECLLACSNPSCQLCSSTPTNCSQCTYGYSLDAGRCFLDSCDILNCVLCSSPASCERCESTYIYSLENNACQPACASVIANCLICSSAQQCFACKPGYGFATSLSNAVQCVVLCSIKYCAICGSDKNCLLCLANYSVSADYKQCELLCLVSGCKVCSSLNVCLECQLGFSLMSNICVLQCAVGYYNIGNDSKISCALCFDSHYACQSCSYINKNKSVLCLTCSVSFYFDNLYEACNPCSVYDYYCNTCNQLQCVSCLQDYILAFNGSCQQIACEVPNCIICLSSSNITCAACNAGFSYNVQTGACEDPICPLGFIFQGESCACPLATKLINEECLPCSDPHCESCNSFGCLACIVGYYYRFDSVCTACPTNCDVCNYEYCIQCSFGFSLFGNGLCSSIGQGISSLMRNNSFVACGLGCSACSNTLSGIVNCVSLKDGYSVFEAETFLCVNTTCRTCSNKNTACASCFTGFALSNGNCQVCEDPNALSCSSTNTNYSLSCSPAYTSASSSSSTGGFCLPCAQNCLKCDLNGPHNCDPFRCALGFVQLVWTANCTACLNSCPVCDKKDLSVCLNCGPRRYKDSKGQCLACPATCAGCTSQTVCTACLMGYSLVQNNCTSNLDYPCAVTGTNSLCVQCFEGYLLNGSACVIDLSCNNQSNCVVCPYRYYIYNSTCLICPQLPKYCLTCDALLGSCLGCKKKFYFTGFKCQPCPKNCLSCTSPSLCNQAANGFYLETFWDGSNSVRVESCVSPCVTCAYTSNYCLSCPKGYAISGSTCFATAIINLSMVLGPSQSPPSLLTASDTDKSGLAKAMQNINWLTASFCSVLPDSLKSKGSCVGVFRFTALFAGSIKLNVQINVNGVQNVAQTQTAIIQSLNSNGIPGASVLVVGSLSPPNTQPPQPPQSPPASTSTSSSPVTAIVVGVLVGVIAVAIIVAVIMRAAKVKKEETDQITLPSQQIMQSQKPIQNDQQMDNESQKENQRNPLVSQIASSEVLGSQ